MIRRFITRRIQAHKGEVIIDLPERGLIRFTGPNSHGKSIIPKVLLETISCSLHSDQVRQSLITRGESWGEFIIELYSGHTLRVVLALSKEKSFYEFTTPDGTVTTRACDSPDLRSLLLGFGFHYDDDHEISLQLYPTYGLMPLINTRTTTNSALIKEAESDPFIETALENFVSWRKTIDKTQERNETEASAIARALESLPTLDQDRETRYADMFTQYAEVLEALETVIFNVPDALKIKTAPKVGAATLKHLKVCLEAVPQLTVAKAPKVAVSALRSLDAVCFDCVQMPRMFDLTHYETILQAFPVIPASNVLAGVHEAEEAVASLRKAECPVCNRRFHDV